MYFAEALLFYVGAVLIARGLYRHRQMVQVDCVNLMTFSILLVLQLDPLTDLAVAEKMIKSVQPTHKSKVALSFSPVTSLSI